jgi:hypothetical protein
VRIEYYYGGQKRRLTAHRTRPDNSTLAAHAVVHPMVADIPLTVEPSTQTSQIEGRPTAILTSTIAVDEPPRSELTWLQERYGFRVIAHASDSEWSELCWASSGRTVSRPRCGRRKYGWTE